MAFSSTSCIALPKGHRHALTVFLFQVFRPYTPFISFVAGSKPLLLLHSVLRSLRLHDTATGVYIEPRHRFVLWCNTVLPKA